MFGPVFLPRQNCSSTHLFGFEGTPEKSVEGYGKERSPPGPAIDHQCAVCSQFLHCFFTVCDIEEGRNVSKSG
jgi:hypothetical protein